MTPREERLALISAIEKLQNSRVICYICGDRPGAVAQIGEDAVRPLYDHLRSMEKDVAAKTNAIDLFLYSRGGAVEVPWRIVSMIREFCTTFRVIVPYRAYSAATMIALGADEIVMGKKAELGPIDPVLHIVQDTEGRRAPEDISIEDLMSFVSFLRERAGLTDQAALSANIATLSQRLRPWVIGAVYRTHAHINLVARKLLDSRKEKMSENKANAVIKSLVEEIYLHGHGIGRLEADALGLPVKKAAQDLDETMWSLFLEYEEMMSLSDAIEPASMISDESDDHKEPGAISACIESTDLLHVHSVEIWAQRLRNQPPQLNINLNLPVQVPATPPANLQQQIGELMKVLQPEIVKQVKEQIRIQSPTTGIVGGIRYPHWRLATEDEG